MPKNNILLISGYAILFAIFSAQSSATCHGHFQNNSTLPWQISFDNNPLDGIKGNAYFKLKHGQFCEESHLKNGPCFIQPGDNMEVDYTTSQGQIDGFVTLTDNNSESKTFFYSNDADTKKCMGIDTEGDDVKTVILDQPSRGGATIIRDYWWN